MKVNEVLSKEMRVPPLKEGEKAVFRLKNAFTLEKGRDEPTCPEVVQLSDKEFIWDPFANNGTGQMVMIGNVVGVKAVREAGGGIKLSDQGAVMMIPETKKPEFIKGYCTLSHMDNDQYAFMMRSKKCVDNIYRPRKSGKIVNAFELVTNKKEVSTAMQMADLQWNAEKIVREKEWVDLKAIKAKLNQSPDSSLHVKSADNDLQGMKMELIKIAKSHPKQLIWSSEDPGSKMRVLVFECQSFGVLTLDNGTWTLMEKGTKYRKIHQVEPQKDAVESLISYFESKNGYSDYMAANQELKFIFKATRGIPAEV